VRIVGKNGLEIDKFVFIHGHGLPRLAENMKSYDCVVSGHIHPQALFDGEWKPAWMILHRKGAGSPRRIFVLPHFSLYASRAGYRPGPPVSIAPFLTRLSLESYRYEMKTLGLVTIGLGEAEDVVMKRG